MLIIAAFAVTFGVFANGSMKATAPSLAEILGHFDHEAAMPQPKVKAVRTAAYRPANVVLSPAVAEAIKPKLHNAAVGAMPVVDALDLSAAVDVTAPLPEFDGRFDDEGWFTLGYFGPKVPSVTARPAGSVTKSFAFNAPAIVRGGSSHKADRSVVKTEHSKMFAPVVASLNIDGAVAAGAKKKSTGHSGLRAAGSRNVVMHAIDLTITPEAAPVLEIEHASPAAEITAIDAAAEKGIFVAAVMPAAVRPAVAIKAAAPVEIVKAHYVASESLFTPIDLAEEIAPAMIAGRTTRPLISKQGVGGRPRHFDSKASVSFGVKHPEVEAPVVVEEPIVTEAHLPTETELAVEAPAPAEAPKPLEPAAVMLDAEHSERAAWLSSYLTTSPEVTAASLDRPKAVTYTPRKAAAAVVTGMTTLNIAPMKRGDGSYCDPNFVGEPIRFSQTAELKLEDLLLQIHNRFGVNFVMGPNVGQLPINIKAGAIPWNVLLRSQLFISGVRAKCIDQTTIELVENSVLPSLQDQAEVKTRFVKLKFLQRTGGGTVDLANRSQGGQNGGQGGGCGGSSAGQGGQTGGGGQNGGGQQGETAGQQSSTKFDKLIIEIEKILGIRSMTESSVGGGGGGGQTTNVQQAEVIRTNRFVTQIPGRNILAIRATDEEHELIDQIIARADRPPFQVVIKALVYTANQDKLYDVGVRTTIIGGTADRRTRGGVFGHTIGGGGTLFDFSTIIGTFDFNVQATALQENGVISVKSRPFATVLDGLCTTLNVGRSIPIVIDSTLGGQGDVVFVDASNNLAVTPYVIDDDNGDPMAVTLELRLGANDVDTSVTARDVPAISQRSIQTQLLLGEDKTAILGGFTVDADTRTVSKTPGLGDIPLIGELFKRRVKSSQINRLYFAISASVIPFGEVIRPVDVPGATTEPPSITPPMKERSDKAEPKQVKGP